MGVSVQNSEEFERELSIPIPQAHLVLKAKIREKGKGGGEKYMIEV